MLSCLPWLTSGSTANWTPGSGSMDSVGSTGSTSDGSVTKMHEVMRMHQNDAMDYARGYDMKKEWHKMQDAQM